MVVATLPSVEALVAGLVDYAGLFPPAGLSMAAAVQNYRDSRSGLHRQALGRFIVPAGRLAEFADVVEPHLQQGEAGVVWRLAVLAGPDVATDVQRVAAFNAARQAHARAEVVIDVLETKAASIEDIAASHNVVPRGLEHYVELPVAVDPSALVAAVGRTGARAKIRTGGVTADAIPSARDVARFMITAARAAVPFKATAGLHHALRGAHPLTYAADSPRAVMHGFLNVFLAAALARSGAPEETIADLLEETDPATIIFGPSDVRWRDQQFTIHQLRQARDQFARSFGSCSFREPIDDLQAMGLM